MAIIPDQDRNDLKRDLRKNLKNDVTIKFFGQGSTLLSVPGRECRYCPQTQELMEELTGLSPKLHLEVYNFYTDSEAREKLGVERIPAIVLGDNGGSRLKFYGIPLGPELYALAEGIKTISRRVSPLSMESRKSLRKVKKPVHIQVFVTPS
jgi:alkyl hydroperoxide reductase subunit AhpF